MTALPDVPLYDSPELIAVTTTGNTSVPTYNATSLTCHNVVVQVRTLPVRWIIYSDKECSSFYVCVSLSNSVHWENVFSLLAACLSFSLERSTLELILSFSPTVPTAFVNRSCLIWCVCVSSCIVLKSVWPNCGHLSEKSFGRQTSRRQTSRRQTMWHLMRSRVSISSFNVSNVRPQSKLETGDTY